jgi:hypothetical protein
MKEVAKKLASKQPYKIVMDDKDRDIPATEKTRSVDVLTLSVCPVGSNFENIPFSLRTNNKFGYTEYKDVSLIDKDGEVVSEVPASSHNVFRDPASFERESRSFRFDGRDDDVIVALRITISKADRTSVHLLLLSRPMTIREMQSMRDSVVLAKKKKADRERERQIEMLWGKSADKEEA